MMQAAESSQLFPDLTVEEFAELKADIARRGEVLVPVELDEQGAILDGHHRVRAWTELRAEGIAVRDYPRIIRPGLSEPEKRAHVRAVNLLRRHLNQRICAAGRRTGGIALAAGSRRRETPRC
jgi:ParB-like chromosome segregation protein Spo0J